MAHCTVQSADWVISFKTTCYSCIVMTVGQLRDWCGCKSPYRAIKRSAGAGQDGSMCIPVETFSGIAGGGLQALVMRDMLNAGSGPDSIAEPLNHRLNRRPSLQQRLPGLWKYTFTALCREHFTISSRILHYTAVYQTAGSEERTFVWNSKSSDTNNYFKVMDDNW